MRPFLLKISMTSLLVLLLSATGGFAQNPNWVTPNAAGYQYSLNITAVTVVDGTTYSNNTNDRLAFFVGTELRGLSAPFSFPRNLTGPATAIHMATVYSNQATGESLTVRYYDATNDRVLESTTPLTFEHATIVGSLGAVLEVVFSSGQDVDISLAPIPGQTTMQGIPFADIDLADYLQQNDNDPLQWSLAANPNLTAQLNGSVLTVSAASPAYVGTTTLTVTVAEMTANAFSANASIAFTVTPAIAPPAWGTVPDQTVQGDGYFNTLHLPDYEDQHNGECLTFDYKPIIEGEGVASPPNWVLTGTKPNTMNVVARPVFTPRCTFAHPNDRLAAFVGNQLAGVAAPQMINGEVYFFLTVSSDLSSSPMELLFYSAELQELLTYPIPIAFSSFAIVGTPLAPTVLDFSPLAPQMDANGVWQMDIRNPTWTGVQGFTLIAADCDYPAALSDTTTVYYCSAGLSENQIAGSTTEGFDCNSYTWERNGETYTTSGTYLAMTPCRTDTLLLTIGHPTECLQVGGNIVWEHDRSTPVPAATVALTGDDTTSANTDTFGDYAITTSGGNLTLTPSKTDNPRQGISAADVTRIRQHALGTLRFNDGYKVIAADVNESNSVTSADAVIIQQALLGNSGAGNLLDNPVWRFVDSAHVFSTPNAPWGFPAAISLMDVATTVTGANFVGVKMGDVNGTWSSQPALTAQPAVWLVANENLEAGSTHRVAFALGGDLPDVAAWQFALRLDPAYVTVHRITPKAVLPLTQDDFGTENLRDGELRTVFAVAQGQPLKAGDVAFELELTVRRSALLSDVLTLDNDVLDGRVYDTALQGGAVKLAFAPVRDKLGLPTAPTYAEVAFELYPNVPNPFVEETLIAFSLPTDAAATIAIHDASGRLITQLSGNYVAGYNTVRLTRDVLKGASGVLAYTVTAGSYTATRRMVAVK